MSEKTPHRRPATFKLGDPGVVVMGPDETGRPARGTVHITPEADPATLPVPIDAPRVPVRRGFRWGTLFWSADRVLEAQPLPGMEDHAGGVQHTARERETQRQCRQLLHHGVIEHHAAPAHGEIKPGRQPVVSTRPCDLQHDADDRQTPHPDQKRDSEIAFLQFHDERRVGRRDQQIDRGMIEAAQHPFGARDRPEIVGRRQHQHRQQARDID